MLLMPAARNIAPRIRTAQRGVTLIEVLVTMLLIAVSLLGLAGVTTRANVSEMESYQRVQALMLVQDMANRMNANRVNAAGATSDSNPTNPVVLDQCYGVIQVGNGYTGTPTCTAGSGAQQAQAIADIQAWDAMLKGSAEAIGTNKIGAMIGAVGCIDVIDAANHVYLISVHWQGLATTTAQTSVINATCKKGGASGGGSAGLYGDERLHRIVTTQVRIGKLA